LAIVAAHQQSAHAVGPKIEPEGDRHGPSLARNSGRVNRYPASTHLVLFPRAHPAILLFSLA
jgi:hypothetical protein